MNEEVLIEEFQNYKKTIYGVEAYTMAALVTRFFDYIICSKQIKIIRCKYFEDILKESYYYSYRYAYDILNKRFIEGEKVILKSILATNYVSLFIKDINKYPYDDIGSDFYNFWYNMVSNRIFNNYEKKF